MTNDQEGGMLRIGPSAWALTRLVPRHPLPFGGRVGVMDSRLTGKPQSRVIFPPGSRTTGSVEVSARTRVAQR